MLAVSILGDDDESKAAVVSYFGKIPSEYFCDSLEVLLKTTLNRFV